MELNTPAHYFYIEGFVNQNFDQIKLLYNFFIKDFKNYLLF